MDSCQTMEPYNKLNNDTHSILHVKQCIICLTLFLKKGWLYPFHNFSVLFISFNNTFLLDGFCGFLNAVILTGYDFHYILFTTSHPDSAERLAFKCPIKCASRIPYFSCITWSVVCASSEINSRFKVFNVTCTVRCTRFPVQWNSSYAVHRMPIMWKEIYTTRIYIRTVKIWAVELCKM